MADAHKNFAYSTVATAPSPATSGVSLVVAAGQGALFPAVPFNATIWPAGVDPNAANAEIVRVTNRSTDTFTIVRAQESTSARTVVITDQIAAAVTVKAFTDLEVVDAAAGTGSLRTLGTGATQAAAGNDSRLSDTRTPTDATVTEAKLNLSDVTTANATTVKHGLLPKLPGGTTNFLREDGTFSPPPGASASAPPFTYLVYKSGSNFFAKASAESGLANVGSNADAAAVLTSCLNNINSSTTPRGTILFEGNTTFTWNTVPAIRRTYAGPFTRAAATTNTSPTVTGLALTSDLSPGMSVSGTGVPVNTLILSVDSSSQVTLTKNATATGSPTLSFYNGPDDEKWLRILGSGGSVLQLGSATRFFDFNRQADYDGFCGVEIGQLEFDANNVVGTSSNHTLIGTLVAGSGTLQRVDFRRIWIHDVVIRNLPTAAIGGNHRAGIWIEVSHVNAGGSTTPEAIRNYMTDITIERYRQLGGNTGILVAGFVPSHADYMAVNIFGDRWRVSDFYIDSLSRDQTVLDPGSGVQLGGQAAGESMITERGEIHCIGDDSEWNGFRQIVVRDVHGYDNGQASFFPCNFGYVNGLDATEQTTQRIVFENCHNHTTNVKATSGGSKPSHAFALNTVGNADMGTITYKQCSATHHVKQTDLGTCFAFYIGSATAYKIGRLIIDDFKATSWYDATGSGTSEAVVFFFYNGPQTVKMKDLDIVIKGDRKTASGFTCWWRPLYLQSPDMRIDIDGYRLTDSTTNSSQGWTMPVCLGKDTSSGTNVIEGVVRGIYHTASPGDTWPYGVYAYTSGSVKKLLVSELDGSRLANYTPYDGDAGNAAAVQLRDIKMPTLALAEVAFTPGATTVAAQYKGGYSGLMTITGGTVTVVSVSTDNSTYRQVAAATNCSFAIDNGMWVKITYSSVPTCAVIPNR